MTPGMKTGDTVSVLAVSWGKGDPHKDAITLVFVDEAGRMREHTKIDNLSDSEMVDEFVDLVKRRSPQVIVIGGFTVATLKLAHLVKKNISGLNSQQDGANGWGDPVPTNGQTDIPVTYVHDDVARIYQHSKRAEVEFSALSPTAKYCVGLARYIQSPLNEYAALGADITAIAFEEDDQHLVN
jgi:transcription elongation factor SPT6